MERIGERCTAAALAATVIGVVGCSEVDSTQRPAPQVEQLNQEWEHYLGQIRLTVEENLTDIAEDNFKSRSVMEVTESMEVKQVGLIGINPRQQIINLYLSKDLGPVNCTIGKSDTTEATEVALLDSIGHGETRRIVGLVNRSDQEENGTHCIGGDLILIEPENAEGHTTNSGMMA